MMPKQNGRPTGLLFDKTLRHSLEKELKHRILSSRRARRQEEPWEKTLQTPWAMLPAVSGPLPDARRTEQDDYEAPEIGRPPNNDENRQRWRARSNRIVSDVTAQHQTSKAAGGKCLVGENFESPSRQYRRLVFLESNQDVFHASRPSRSSPFGLQHSGYKGAWLTTYSRTYTPVGSRSQSARRASETGAEGSK
mmetsp:Transcript_56655/g.104885  ORF Transcript_56655/g.104885 Transcript_56655/m.104885 type:complete len:194 (-) Transcript_56655:84-665(-)